MSRVTLNFSCGNAFNLDVAKVLLFGKGLRVK